MPWFIQVTAGVTVFLITILVIDLLRRKVKLQVPVRNNPSVPDEILLRLAKTVVEGGFDGASFGKKPFADLFPPKKSCPHCQGTRRKVWDLGEAGRLLSDVSKLARGIRQRRYCRSCLSRLSEVAAAKGQLKGLGKGDPTSLAPKLARGCLLIIALSLAVSLLSAAPGIILLLLRMMVNLPTIMFRY